MGHEEPRTRGFRVPTGLSVCVCLSVCQSVCVCVSSLCLCPLPGGKGTASHRRTGPQALPDQQRSCPCLSFVVCWFPSNTFLSCLFKPWRRRAQAIAGLARTEPPNSGQAAEDESGSFVDVLVSEQGQHSSSSGLTLPQQQNQQAGSQTQSASSMDQLQNGLVQYQPSGSNPVQPTANALFSTSQPGTVRHHSQGKTSTLTSSLTLNRLTLSAETMLRRDRTLLMPQTFRCQMHPQCMISPLRDARLVEDAVSGASVHSLQQAKTSVPPALCAEYDSPMVRHDSGNGETAKPINHYLC